MVKSSIVVPPQATGVVSRKRLQETSPVAEEPKRPRLQLNADGKQRHQRLFGVLLGTLNKFKDESEHKSEAEIKRQAIESKLQEKLANEKKELNQEIQAEREHKLQAIEARKRQSQRTLEDKREAAALKQKELQARFLMTSTEPRLCYQPSTLTSTQREQTDQQLEAVKEAQKEYEARQEKRQQAEEEDSALQTPPETSHSPVESESSHTMKST
ncbi:pinin/SDK/memA/ protein conserved region-domain-containing protein [Spinellus fusiger]|nr:pinin/SDK/memA/ protein conserved region-domain-containing protein [Spinellus fusiger]